MDASNMTLKEATKRCWQKKFTFTGRASRREYWLGGIGLDFLFCLVYLGLMLCAVLLFYAGSQLDDVGAVITMVIGFIPLVIGLILFGIVMMALMVRRLHDMGKRGWWALLVFVPIVGNILVFYWLLQPSDRENRYGPRPEGAGDMTLCLAMKLAYKRKFSLSGRSHLSEYWLGIGGIYLLFCSVEALSQLVAILILAIQQWDGLAAFEMGQIVYDTVPSIVVAIFCIALTIMSITLTVRRLHDIGKCGWWWFLNLIPFIGMLILAIWLIRPSDGDNQYGARDYSIEELLDE